MAEQSYIIRPYFETSITGPVGPWFNTDLDSNERYKLIRLLVAFIVLVVGFGALGYWFVKEKADFPRDCGPIEEPKDFKEFIDSEALADPQAFFLGMGAGLVFGFIDNFGLWFGMDALDAAFDPSKVPWVMGYGGKRPYAGSKEEFRNAKLKNGKRLGDDVSKLNIKSKQKAYDTLINGNKKKGLFNQKAFTNPQNPMFLGTTMTSEQFIKAYNGNKLTEQTYINMINKANTKNQYPGTDKNLGKQYEDGYSFGKLTQAGIGNTFSDALGAFMATFIGVIIVNSKNYTSVSLISEALGIIFGCMIAILIARMLSNKT